MKYIKAFLYWLIQCTWALPQTLIGFFLMLKNRKLNKQWYHGALITYHNGDWGGVSLGAFVFVNGNRDEKWTAETNVHEYGHTIQSLILGPLYLLVIGIPSMIWCNTPKYRKLREEKGVSYFSFYPERWANYLGSKVTGEPSPR